MKEITIGDKSLMQISKEDILQLAVMQGCCALWMRYAGTNCRS